MVFVGDISSTITSNSSLHDRSDTLALNINISCLNRCGRRGLQIFIFFLYIVTDASKNYCSASKTVVTLRPSSSSPILKQENNVL